MARILFMLIALSTAAVAAEAQELKVATWNLGWHLSRAEAQQWIAECGAPFSLNSTTKLWEPAQSGKPGWELKWGRNAPIAWDIGQLPPCDVYQAGWNIVPVTEKAYEKRLQQIATVISGSLQPDIIAFQEVSGEQAVRDVLPNNGADYNVCAFTGFKVQRLAFAWKKTLGPAAECAVEPAVSLPSLPAADQVRPGLSLALDLDGKTLRLLNVHLKSSCVSPLEAKGPNDKGALAGSNSACATLQQQVAPLEHWLEAKSKDTNRIVVLGDFNRNLWHERHAAGPVRTDNSDPAGPLPGSAKVISLLGEINDGVPGRSQLTLLEEACLVNATSQTACKVAESSVSKNAQDTLRKTDNLGCRNPIGLDHILIGSGMTAPGHAEKFPLGRMGRTLSANSSHPDPLLALSDHCPLTTIIRY